MEEEIKKNGVDVRIRCDVQKIHVNGRRVTGVTVNGRRINARAVVSNANVKTTILDLVGEEHFDKDFLEQVQAVRLNNSSTQVYIALKPGETIDEAACGDLFSSTAPVFRTDLLLSRQVTSRTYSFYYPKTCRADRTLSWPAPMPTTMTGPSFQRRIRGEQTALVEDTSTLCRNMSPTFAKRSTRSTAPRR